jgi:ABC-type transport system involved in cytochrome bd biosynthesis fused ATPase/permease subunit
LGRGVKIASLIRDSWGSVLALAGLRFATLLAVPLALLGLGHSSWALAPLAGGALLEFVRLGWRQRLRRRLRVRCLRDAARDALDKAALVPEAQVDSAFWAAYLAEYLVSIDVPALIGAASAGLAILLWAAVTLDTTSLLGLAALALTATVFSLLSRRFRTLATDAIVDQRQATAGLLAAAERDVGEIYGDQARAPFLKRLGQQAERWCRAEDRLELRQAFHRLGLVAIVLIAVFLLARAHGIHALELESDALFTLESVSHSLLLGFYVPIVYVLVAHADSILISRAEIARLQPPVARTELPTRRLANKPQQLRAEALELRYGDHLALDLPRLELSLGAPLVVRGPNGSGKTTLGLLLCGVLSPTRGGLTLDGAACSDLDRDDLAFVPQNPLILETLSVRENIELVAPQASPEAMKELLLSLGFEQSLEHRASALSRGEQRRLAITRALLKAPRLLVLDEPDSWLDQAGRSALLAVLEQEAGERAVVVITHRGDFVPRGAEILELDAQHHAVPAHASGASTA